MDTRYYSKKQEERVAKLLGGKVSANSGATGFFKGDIRTKDFLIECKTATKEIKSVSIKKEWLLKLNQEKFSMGKSQMAIAFDFGDNKDWFIISDDLMQWLIKHYEEEVK